MSKTTIKASLIFIFNLIGLIAIKNGFAHLVLPFSFWNLLIGHILLIEEPFKDLITWLKNHYLELENKVKHLHHEDHTYFIQQFQNELSKLTSYKTLLVYFIIVFLALTIEIIGVNTGIIFGKYTYLNNLGLKLLNTPIIIGFNWASLCLVAYKFAIYIHTRLLKNIHLSLITWRYIYGLISGLTLLILDFFIEVDANRLGFWHWTQDSIPVQNYISWFIIAFLFIQIFISVDIDNVKATHLQKNTDNIYLYLSYYFSQIMFFIFI